MQEDLSEILDHFISELKWQKPNDHSDLDRNFSVCITDAEKLRAYLSYFIYKNR